MISEELKLIVDKFNEQGKMNFLEETTEEKISEFEKERSIKLPTKFKEWLLFSDGGEFFLPAGIQLYGIEHKPIIDVDNNDRPSEDYIVIGALASGDPIPVSYTHLRAHETGRNLVCRLLLEKKKKKEICRKKKKKKQNREHHK